MDGDMTAAATLRHSRGCPLLSVSSSRLAIRNRGSPLRSVIARNSAGDLIVDGVDGCSRRTSPSTKLPAKTYADDSQKFRPDGTRQPLVERTLVGMQELVGGEGVVVDHPLAMNVGFKVGDRRIIYLRIDGIVVVAI